MLDFPLLSAVLSAFANILPCTDMDASLTMTGRILASRLSTIRRPKDNRSGSLTDLVLTMRWAADHDTSLLLLRLLLLGCNNSQHKHGVYIMMVEKGLLRDGQYVDQVHDIVSRQSPLNHDGVQDLIASWYQSGARRSKDKCMHAEKSIFLLRVSL